MTGNPTTRAVYEVLIVPRYYPQNHREVHRSGLEPPTLPEQLPDASTQQMLAYATILFLRYGIRTEHPRVCGDLNPEPPACKAGALPIAP